MNINSLFKFSLWIYDFGLWFKEVHALWKYRRWNTLAKNNKKLIEYKKSEICYVCGNGPSLKKVDFDTLDGDTIVMNDHWRIAGKFSTHPTFYLINDDGYANETFKERLEGVLNCYPDIPHVFSVSLGPVMDGKYSKVPVNIFYYNNIGRTFKSRYKIDFTKCTFYTWNVVSAAIQLAIYLGYKEVRLLGCDYSLFASRFKSHMYDKDGEVIPFVQKIRDRLYKFTFTTHIHYEIAGYAKEHGIRVINMTSETLLDAYEIDSNSRY